MSSPELPPNDDLKIEVNNLCQIDIRQVRPNVQRCKLLKFQCPAPLAAILMLAVRAFPLSFFIEDCQLNLSNSNILSQDLSYQGHLNP